VTPPVLHTERLTLRAPALSDFEPYAAFLASTRSGWPGGAGREAAWREFASSAGLWPLRGVGPFTILERGSNRWIGETGFAQPVGREEPELGWNVAEEAEGSGIATEAAAAARDWAFGPGGVASLVSYVSPENARSIRVAEKLGAAPDSETWSPHPGAIVFRHRREGAR
jgi:RimJ/RimL family protein N-acetyltransferase